MMHAIDDANGNETVGLCTDAAVPRRAGKTTASRSQRSEDRTWGPGVSGRRASGDSAITSTSTLTPKIVDVDANARPSAPAWRTLLVGGLGKGGNRYFALDVTDPAVGHQ